MAGASEAQSGPMRIWRNARLATFAEGQPGLGIVEQGAVVANEGRIVYAGPEADMPAALSSAETIDCEGRWITPGLVDCHTHLVHAGNRAPEFEMRLAGATYEEVARAGGGIVSSVKSLRAASEADLLRQSLPRLNALIAEGVTTIEIKSGYGLDTLNEAKSLRVARLLGHEPGLTPTPTPPHKGEGGGQASESPSSLWVFRPGTRWTHVRRHRGRFRQLFKEAVGCHFARCAGWTREERS